MKPETSAAGKKWTYDEEQLLIKDISDNKKITDIAKEHKRTYGGIMSRIKLIAVRMIQIEGKTISEVCKILRMTPKNIEYALEKYNKPSKYNIQAQAHVEDELNVLKDIREILLRIESQLSSIH